jgi:hypothetical protein
MDNILDKDSALLKVAMQAWESLEMLRQRRRRLKGFAYGRQWCDMVRDSQGRVMSEEQYLIENGRVPITNNLIRQLVKSIVGRYRYMAAKADGEELAQMLSRRSEAGVRSLDDYDARALEEFLISGCVVQRISDEVGHGAGVENVSPERIFLHRLDGSSAGGNRLIGVLHDMPLTTMLQRFGDGTVERHEAIKRLYAGKVGAMRPLGGESASIVFSEPSQVGCCRVIEVWEYLPSELLRCHDRRSAEYFVEDYSDEVMARLETENNRRRKIGEPSVDHYLDITESWRCSWLAPSGEVLSRYWATGKESHPFVTRFYPLIDGEVHSMVEDVVDQQKYVNRLISLLDSVIASSAKGVLLYPTDQLPEGFTWRDMRRIWSNPSGVLPFKRTSKTVMPHQVHSSGSSSGASEMLRLQLELFDEISGTTGALRGKSSHATGAEMLHTELENGTISMLDMLASFRAFIDERNARLRCVNSDINRNNCQEL